MARDALRIDHVGDRAHDVAYPSGSAHTDGVGDVDLVAAHGDIAPGDVDHGGDRDLALVGTAERATQRAAQAQAVGLGGRGDRLEAIERFGDRTVDVSLREGLAGGTENDDFVGARGKRRVEAFHVGGEYGVDRARAPADLRHHFRGIRHLGRPFRRDERRGLDVLEAGVGEPVDQFDLDLRRDELLFVLQTVARGDFDDFDFGGHHGRSSACVRVGRGGQARETRSSALRRMWPASSSVSSSACRIAGSSPLRCASVSSETGS